ncbi:DUF2478 domain-containing protein [Methylocella sp.]|uniref:DUF2478 domain-containing protein n=1 Tax=Methylocella sp. TaxID=1978226 RepID=UPI0035B44889
MTSANGSLAAVTGRDSGEVQAAFVTIANELLAKNLRVVGVIGEALALPHGICTAGFLRDIASDAKFKIYLQNAPRDTSCHLDENGVNAACRHLLPQIPSCDLVIVSKFGKLEASGAGLAPAFEAAVKACKPVLTSVSERHWAAWRAFAPGAANLGGDAPAIQSWLEKLRPSVCDAPKAN